MKKKSRQARKTVLSNVKQFRRPLSKTCTRCQAEPRMAGQRWGKNCFAAYMAERRSQPQRQKASA